MHALKSWMKGKQRLLSAGLLATFLTSPLAWAQDPGFNNQPMQGDVQPGARTGRRTEVVTLGESLTLSMGGRKIKQIMLSREGIITDIRESEPNNPTLYSARALSVGAVSVTLIAEDGTSETFEIRVDPDIEYIKSIVRTNFPRANIDIVQIKPQNTLIVTGWVESVEEIEPMANLIKGFARGLSQGQTQQGAGQAGGGQFMGPILNDANVTMAVRVAGVHQVHLEVCIARVQRSEARNLGFSFEYGGNDTIFGSAFAPAVSAAGGVFAPRGGSILDSALAGTSQGGGTNLHLGLVGNNKAFLGLLQALRQENLSKILASPSLVTISGRPAEFLVGGELPAVVAGGAGGGAGAQGGGGAIQFREFGTRLTFLPVILGDGKIRVQVQAESSQPDPALSVSSDFFNAPAFIINRVQSTIEMENNQTFIVGGLIQTERGGIANKVPVLGDLPFIGAAFRSMFFVDRETELVVCVTVTLVDPLDKGQRPTCLPGQETRTPTDFELFCEGILEAPRGPRDPFPGKTYVPAYKLDAPFGNPMGHCDNSKLWQKDCGLGCGHGACGTGCATGCATGCVPGCAPAGAVILGPVNGTPVQSAPAPAPAPANGTTMLVPSEPKVVIVPAQAPVQAAPVVPAVKQVPAAPVIPPLPEASRVVPALPQQQ